MRCAGTDVASIAAAVVVVLVALTSRASAEKDIAIDPEGSCTTSSCHDGITKKDVVHVPAAAGEDCTICHETVAEGKHSFAPLPKGAELCFTCHDDEAFADKTTHGPVGAGRCVACHNPHASDIAALLRAEPPNLCFSCHKRVLKDADGQRLPSPMRTFRDPAMKLHPPFEAGECVGCHMPHASPNYRLLVAPYPRSLYTQFSSDKYVCFMCHDDEAFTEPRTLDLTNFRNGNLNLHYRHVNRKKGRSCKACHHHHGATNEALIRDQTPFGKRFIHIRSFKKTPTGGSCAPTCHLRVAYDRYDPVFNAIRVTPREGKDATPQELQKAKTEQVGQ